jgi:hypothetical protein
MTLPCRPAAFSCNACACVSVQFWWHLLNKEGRYKDLADMLTGKIKTPRGADRWQATQVKRIVERVGS